MFFKYLRYKGRGVNLQTFVKIQPNTILLKFSDALECAIKLSNLHKFLGSLPQGLNTVIGERGIQISGGQRQCIGLARTLYHNPYVIILDEATSNLDNESEHYINSMLEKLYGIKTIIIVAHHLKTVRNCDKIIFMKHGHIDGSGTFEGLKHSNLGFRKLVDLEFI